MLDDNKDFVFGLEEQYKIKNTFFKEFLKKKIFGEGYFWD